MARFRCSACGREGRCDYRADGHRCPLCGSADVVFAVAVEELPDEILDATVSAERPDDADESED